jgi:hypothetical protein
LTEGAEADTGFFCTALAFVERLTALLCLAGADFFADTAFLAGLTGVFAEVRFAAEAVVIVFFDVFVFDT